MRFKDSWILGPLSFDTTPLGGETSPRLGASRPFGVETWGGECNGWNGLKSWIGVKVQKACIDSRWWFHMFRRHIFNIAILDGLNPLSCMIRIYFTSYWYVSYLSPGLNMETVNSDSSPSRLSISNFLDMAHNSVKTCKYLQFKLWVRDIWGCLRGFQLTKEFSHSQCSFLTSFTSFWIMVDFQVF